jgi:hypothetical protein
VRRTDSIDRVYYVDRETGKRASGDLWRGDRERIAFERAVFRREREERVERERERPPFPTDAPPVGPMGAPIGPAGVGGPGPSGPIRVPDDWDGEAVELPEDTEFEWFAVVGEDETG